MREISSSNGIKFEPVGFCIYCGSREGLTDEHVVPYGLGGNALILPKSSCRPCATITGAVENNFLRITSGQLRELLKAPTRGKTVRTGQSERPVFERQRDGQLIPAHYYIRRPIEDAPILYPAVVLPPPGIFTGADHQALPEVTVSAVLLNRGSISEAADGHRVYMGKFRPSDTLRQLLKIAYGYAVGTLGPGAFRPMVQELILGKSEHFGYLLGCLSESDPPNDKMVFLEQGYAELGSVRYVIVKIRIYGQLPTPTYCAVVGEIN